MSALVALHGVTAARGGAEVLTGVDLEILRGERVALIGANGAGKTSLLRTIMGLDRPLAGRIRLFGADCAGERDFRAARMRIGFLFQDSDDQLFCPTVIEDVAFGPLNLGCTQSEAIARAQEALDTLGIGALAERVSHRLSGGEKRLACLAGLLAMRPELLLLDEPTNGVDARNGALLRQALDAFGGAMLLVSHDAGFVAEFATRALVMRHGRLVPAQIHDHAHTHRHLHVHPEPE